MAENNGFTPQKQDPPGATAAMDPVPDHGETSWLGTGRLSGARALVTGGDSGIGRAVVIAYAREGADVVFTHLPEEHQDAAETVRVVEESDASVTPIAVDLTERELCEEMVAEAVRTLGGLDVLVNNAGFQWARGEPGIDGLEPDMVERVIATNLLATIWITRAAVPHMEAGGSIINTTSIQAYDPSTTLLDYAATKAALNNLTANLAADLGPRGIRVNAVAPGPIWTPLQPATKDGDNMPGFGGNTPLGRAGQPSELAGAFVFLASPLEASYVSGAVVGVTGGRAVF